MKFYREATPDGDRLFVRVDERAYDLTAANPDLTSFLDLVTATAVTDRSLPKITERLLDEATPVEDPEGRADRPVVPDEVWAAGVTYQISEEAREAESGMPDVYLDVYRADRPEVFFKATPSRTVGPGESIGVRADSDWNVPEPELALVLHRGELVGYTIGNDVSSRAIEGRNPLYLPQAKTYDRCCAIGPSIVPADAVDPLDLSLRMRIERADDTIYEESTSTSELVRTPDELIEYCTRHDAVAETTVLLTGTSLVPEESFTLSPGDTVHIDIESIGTLTNSVVTV